MRYVNARSSQRFIAYLIDLILMQLVVGFILKFIPSYTRNANIIVEYYNDIIQGNIIEDIELLKYIMQCSLSMLAILLLVYLPIFALYLILLPYFWDKQTLGRWVMHVKVVSKEERKASIKNLILREIVGGFLILHLLSGSIIIPLIYWYFSVSCGRTLSDMIGGTRLVDSQVILVEEKNEAEVERDYVDAVFKEVPSTEEKNQDNEETDYKVF